MNPNIPNNPFASQAEQTFIIGKKTFISKVWPTRSKAFKNLPLIGGVFAVPIAVLAGSGGTDMQNALAMASELFFQKLAEPETQHLVDIVLQDVYIKQNGGFTAINVDEHLEDIDELFQLMANVLNQHYGKLVKGKGSKQLLEVLLPLQSPPTM